MQVCKLQEIAFFLRHCRCFFKFPSFRHKALKKKAKISKFVRKPTEKWQRNDNVSRHIWHFLQPAKLSCVVTFCFFLSYGENVVIFSFFWLRFSYKYWKISKINYKRQRNCQKKIMSKNAIFCNLQNCHFFDLLVPFLSGIWKKEKRLIRTTTKNDNASRKTSLQCAKKNIAETTDQNSCYQKMIQKNDDRNDRQNWRDKKKQTKLKWQK